MQEQPQEQNVQPSIDSDIEERVSKFNEEIQVLLGKYELTFGASAMFTPDGRIMAKPVILSTRKEQAKVAEEKNPEVKLDNPQE